MNLLSSEDIELVEVDSETLKQFPAFQLHSL